MPNEREDIRWQAPEFEYAPKRALWYWVSIIIAVLFMGAAAWQKNFLFGFFVLVAELLVLVWANRKPKLFWFTLGDHGLLIGEKSYPYADMDAFSYEKKDGDWDQIILKLRKRVQPTLRVSLSAEIAEEVRAALKKRVREVEHAPSLIDVIEQVIGF